MAKPYLLMDMQELQATYNTWNSSYHEHYMNCHFPFSKDEVDCWDCKRHRNKLDEIENAMLHRAAKLETSLCP